GRLRCWRRRGGAAAPAGGVAARLDLVGDGVHRALVGDGDRAYLRAAEVVEHRRAPGSRDSIELRLVARAGVHRAVGSDRDAHEVLLGRVEVDLRLALLIDSKELS